MSKKYSSLLISFFLFSLFTTPAFAANRSVLGLSTSNLSIPPTVEGPGFLLPDNPLYFLDGWKQSVRLFFALTPEAKAKVYSGIAGERMAELRFELLKNNSTAAEIALDGIRENTKNAALSLDDAHLQGRQVGQEAEDLNRQIKEHLFTLDMLSLSASGEMKAAVQYVTQTLADAKAVVENSLPADQLQQEIKDDTARSVGLHLSQTATAAEELQADLDELNQEASAAAQSLPKRQQAIKNAIQEDSEALKNLQNQQALAQEQKKEESLRLQADAEQDAVAIVQKAQQAAADYKASQK